MTAVMVQPITCYACPWPVLEWPYCDGFEHDQRDEPLTCPSCHSEDVEDMDVGFGCDWCGTRWAA